MALLVPRMGIAGYLVTIYVTEILNAALSITRLLRISGFSPRIGKLLVRPLACAIGACYLMRLLLNAPLSLPLALQILLCTLFYLILLLLSGSFGKSDRAWLRNFLGAGRQTSVCKEK